jgi:hypothetical protein
VLVDNIRTELKLTAPAQIPLQPQPQHAADGKPETVSKKQSPAPGPVTDSSQGNDDNPPMPEDPPEWDTYSSIQPGQVEHEVVALEPIGINEETIGHEEAPASGMLEQPAPPARPPAAVLTPKLPTAAAPPDLGEQHPPQMVTIILRPSGDPNRDIRRIARLHGTFISYPGTDRFAFQIFEQERGHLIEFPNDTTHLCAELLALIKAAVGEENLRIEPILYH